MYVVAAIANLRLLSNNLVFSSFVLMIQLRVQAYPGLGGSSNSVHAEMSGPENLGPLRELIPPCKAIIYISASYLSQVIFIPHTVRNCCVSLSACEQTQCVFSALSTSKEVLRKHQGCCGYAQPTCTPEDLNRFVLQAEHRLDQLPVCFLSKGVKL